MLNIFNSIILGIVEGVTEFLPVSSTGHLILVSHLLKLDNTNFLKSFEIIIQLGAISSVFIFYYKHFFNIENLKKIFIAFLPTAIIGFTLYKILKEYLLGNTLVVISSLFFGGIIMILIEKRYIKNNENKLKSSNSISENILEEDLLSLKNVSYKKSFYLGL
jgi:undecaprenyl-diphosphatase